VGGGGRWRGGGELRGEGGCAKQERKEHEKKGESWGEGKERWRCGKGETCMREEGEDKGGSRQRHPAVLSAARMYNL